MYPCVCACTLSWPVPAQLYALNIQSLHSRSTPSQKLLRIDRWPTVHTLQHDAPAPAQAQARVRWRMLLLVFFLSRVDDSHDKVLKLAPLKQPLSKVNLNVPVELPGVYVFNEAPRYDSRGFFRGIETCIFASRMCACACTHVQACLRG